LTGPSAIVGFVRALRDEGIRTGPTTAADLLSALEIVGAASAEDVYWAFRSLTVISREQVPAFDRVFASFFKGAAEPALVVAGETQRRTWAIHGQDQATEGDGDDATDEMNVVGASSVERLMDRDFAELTAEEEAEVRKLIASMVWKPAITVARRRRPSRLGDRPDLRRTLRSAVGLQGDLIRLATTERRHRRRPLVFIADVSGSMERYAEMLLYFAHAGRGQLGKVEAFVFSTRLTRITPELKTRRPSEAIARVADSVHDWSGGTRIGEAIKAFNHEWSRRVCRGGPIAVIVSDGWDRGDPDQLSEQMARLRRSVNRIVWLNPLASRDGYSAETRGMRAAMPYIDDFLGAGTLRDLATLVALLESVPAKR
jgi:uncharacterized protein with von Willebrand factor type A (vWA) domain